MDILQPIEQKPDIEQKSVPPELLAPAGSEESLYAAVENRADAVYFGISDVGNLNARARARNIPLEKLEEIVEFLHSRNVKAYLTLNTLVFPEEFETVETLLKEFDRVGVDAVLVQDLGVARLARALTPSLTLHASTQMSLTATESFEMVARLGIKRIVLPRELSIAQMRRLRETTDLELETFVHGSLCISFSGRCYASLALGGRSANRGQCAQPCRLQYTLMNGAPREAYHFSPTDLCALPWLGELIDSGICAFKIEGRLKPPEYVAEVTRVYREALDRLWEERETNRARMRQGDVSPDTSRGDDAVSKKERSLRDGESVNRLALRFSRGFSSGWLEGVRPKTLVPGTVRAHRGIALGKVLEKRKDAVLVRLTEAIHRGDGVLFENANDSERPQGGRVYEIFRKRISVSQGRAGENVLLTFGNGAIDVSLLEVGQEIRKTSDSRIDKDIRKSLQAIEARRKKKQDAFQSRDRVPIRLTATAAVGRTLRVDVFRDAHGNTGSTPVVRLESETPLLAAKKHPLDAETLREQFSRLGETPFVLESLDATLDGKGMLPLSVLGKMRRDMIARLLENPGNPDGACDEKNRLAKTKRVVSGRSLATLRQADREWCELREKAATNDAAEHCGCARETRVHLLIRDGRLLDPANGTLPVAPGNARGFSLDRCRDAGCRSVYLEASTYKEYERSVEALRGKGLEVVVAAPGILKSDDRRFPTFLANLRPDAVLVRNLGALRFFLDRGIPCIGDFSLNIVNDLSFRQVFESAGHVTKFHPDSAAELLRVTPGYDLDAPRLRSLLKTVPGARVELVVRGRVPLFTMEHCLWKANFLAEDEPCDRMCHTHPLRVRDRRGAVHTLRTDIHCRNIVENSTPFEIAQQDVRSWKNHGVRHFRLEWDDRLDFETFLQTIRTLRSGDETEATDHAEAFVSGNALQ